MVREIRKSSKVKKKKKKTFCGFPWVETSTAGRVYDLCVYYMTGAPEGSPKVVLCGFFYGKSSKVREKSGNFFKSCLLQTPKNEQTDMK